MRVALTAAVALVISSCAHALPDPAAFVEPLPSTSTSFQMQLAIINQQPIEQSRKTLGASVLFQAHERRADINRYLMALQNTHGRNTRLTRDYGWAQGIVGGMAGFTAPAVLAEEWAVSVPVTLGLFNWIGLGTLKSNVEPTVREGETRLQEARSLSLQFAEAGELFLQFALAEDSASARTRFDAWATRTQRVNASANDFLGLLPMPAAPPPE